MKRAFTLVEILISVTLISLIFIYLYSSIDALKFSNKFYEEKNKELKVREKFLTTIYNDIAFAKGGIKFLDKDSKDYSILQIDNSKNSLYNIKNPNVLWYVSKKNNTLIRLESKDVIKLPMGDKGIYTTHLDRVIENCKSFKVYESNGSKSFLVYLKDEKAKPIIFEFNKL
jgi:prepilin-type N-terminal cleavage/methylation domain-containing protein